MGKNARQTSRLTAKSTLKPARNPKEESLATTADVLGKKLVSFAEPTKTPEKVEMLG
jgi:chromosome partitioning protein